MIEISPEIASFALRMVVERIRFRIDAMNERGLDGVSISKGFAAEIVRACRRGSELLENPEPAQAGLTAGGGSGSANVSAGVTGGGECAVGDAAGEIGGRLEMAPVGDPAAGDPAALTRDRADELSRTFVALYKAIDWPTFGSDRDRDLYLCEAVGALDRAGEHALADRVAEAVSRTGGDGREHNEVPA